MRAAAGAGAERGLIYIIYFMHIQYYVLFFSPFSLHRQQSLLFGFTDFIDIIIILVVIVCVCAGMAWRSIAFQF